MICEIQGYVVSYTSITPDHQQYFVAVYNGVDCLCSFIMIRENGAYKIRNSLTVPAFVRQLETPLASPLLQRQEI